MFTNFYNSFPYITISDIDVKAKLDAYESVSVYAGSTANLTAKTEADGGGFFSGGGGSSSGGGFSGGGGGGFSGGGGGGFSGGGGGHKF